MRNTVHPLKALIGEANLFENIALGIYRTHATADCNCAYHDYSMVFLWNGKPTRGNVTLRCKTMCEREKQKMTVMDELNLHHRWFRL